MKPPRRPMPEHLREHARRLRRESTRVEHLLWRLLRNRQIDGHKFRRQYAVSGYIMDFYCHEARLAIELDGGGHNEAAQRRHDESRDAALRAAGIRVLRFWNHDVLQRTDAVLQAIWNALQDGELVPRGGA